MWQVHHNRWLARQTGAVGRIFRNFLGHSAAKKIPHSRLFFYVSFIQSIKVKIVLRFTLLSAKAS